MEVSVNTIVAQEELHKRGYEIIQEIGRGAQGVCWTVNYIKYNSKLVCKCIKVDSKLGTKQRLQIEKEIYTLTHAIHNNIVKIYDHFSDEFHIYMIIEYCEYGNLLNIIRESHKLEGGANEHNYEYIRNILRDVLSALEYCHDEMHLAHHDLKPSNIVINRFGRAKLCDFGLCHLICTDEDKKHELDKCGSILYMSPQLIQYSLSYDTKYDLFAADIWAFGVTAYCLVCSEHPFKGRIKQQVLEDILSNINSDGSISSNSVFSLLPSDLPDDIKKIIMRSLVFNESERATAKELLDYLQLPKINRPQTIIKKVKSGYISNSPTPPAVLLMRSPSRCHSSIRYHSSTPILPIRASAHGLPRSILHP